MRRILAGSAVIAASLAMSIGAAPAGANGEFDGQTYAKALESVSSWGGTLIIATREGSYLPTEQCVIVGTRKSLSLDSSGRSRGGGKFLVDLNCNDTSALNGHPGNSVTTPSGKKALEQKQTATMLSKDYAAKTAEGAPPLCEKGDNYLKWCVRVCQESDACSAELVEFLGL